MREYVPVNIDAVVHVTEKAVLVRHWGHMPDTGRPSVIETWVPLSVLEFGDEGDIREDASSIDCIHVAEWWAEREGLV